MSSPQASFFFFRCAIPSKGLAIGPSACSAAVAWARCTWSSTPGSVKRFVAKVLRERLASDPQLLERIRIEAQALGQLRHPHIVSVSTFGKTVDGRPYIIMEYLQGAPPAGGARRAGAFQYSKR